MTFSDTKVTIEVNNPRHILSYCEKQKFWLDLTEEQKLLFKRHFTNFNDEFIVISFDPWHYKDEDAILAAFYKEFEHSMTENFILPGIKKAFRKYTKLISTGVSYVINVRLDFEIEPKGLEKIKGEIQTYLDLIGKKILIIIDDIDRLQPNEVLLIFKLVRLNTKFKNTIFLLSFDEKKVREYLRGDPNTDTEFMDKIIQKPVPLPEIEQRDIDNFLFDKINSLVEEIKVNED